MVPIVLVEKFQKAMTKNSVVWMPDVLTGSIIRGFWIITWINKKEQNTINDIY